MKEENTGMLILIMVLILAILIGLYWTVDSWSPVVMPVLEWGLGNGR